MARQTLGRGLNALIGDAAASTTEGVSGTIELDIDLIEPNPQQPRTRFDDSNLGELAQSIRANGVIQPIVVRRQDARYQIVAGERRWRAAQMAELRKIPAYIREVSDEKLLELALIENIQRQELNPIEEANAYRNLIEKIGLTQEMVAERVGKERSVIATTLRLLRLSGDLQRQIQEGVLSAGHGRALLTTDDPQVRRAVANLVIDNGWSVRETERVVKHYKISPSVPGMKTIDRGLDANMKAAETKLMRTLKTNVKIAPGKKGASGRIEIEYYSIDDLDRIYELIVNH
jgi:ParB family transcriptional regulator, chromosome partitioning protein